MHFEHQGISLWYGTADTPAPQGELPTDGEISITIAVQPIDASNHVEIQYRVNQGAIHLLTAQWLRNDPIRKTQYFKVRLPVFRSGDTVEYGVICRCAGRQVPDPKQAQILGSSFRLVATTTELTVEKLSQSSPRAESNSAIATTTPTSSRLLQPNPRPPEQPNIVIPSPLNTSSQPGLPTNPTMNGGANPARDRPIISNPTLAELAHKIGLENQSGLIKALGDQGISTLEDVRKAGGIGNLKNLAGVPNNSAVKILEAHANLSVLSSDWEVNAKLIEKGFTSIDAIARIPTDFFIEITRSELDGHEAAQLHREARAKTAVLDNILTIHRLYAANGYRSKTKQTAHALVSPKGDSWVGNAPQKVPGDFTLAGEPNKSLHEEDLCQCRDCDAAVSPQAYLADLLAYTVNYRIQKPGAIYVTLDDLVATFHQPFDKLPSSCAAVEEEVRQVRLCVEVLRKYLGDRPLANSAQEEKLKAAEKNYRLRAYTTLLTKIGTSYEEIRRIQVAQEPQKKELADRLGLDRSDRLSALLLDPSADSTQTSSNPRQPQSLTEEKLESLFGLVATAKSDGSAIDPPREVTWKLDRPSQLINNSNIVFPDLLQWQLNYLQQQRQQADWPADLPLAVSEINGIGYWNANPLMEQWSGTPLPSEYLAEGLSINRTSGNAYPPATNAATVSVLSDREGYLYQEIAVPEPQRGGSLNVAIAVRTTEPRPEFDRALIFDGVDDYISVSASSKLSLDPSATVEIWINPASTRSVGSILSKEQSFAIARFADGTIRWAFQSDRLGWDWIDTGYVALENRWTQVTIAYDTDSGMVHTYADGKPVHSSVISGTITASEKPLYMGGDPDATQPFSGLLGEVRIWNKVRSPSEIENDLHRRLGGSEPGLLAYWRFDETSEDTVQDQTKNGNSGVLGGGVETSRPQWRDFLETIRLEIWQGIATGDKTRLLERSFSLSEAWVRFAAQGTLSQEAEAFQVRVYVKNRATIGGFFVQLGEGADYMPPLIDPDIISRQHCLSVEAQRLWDERRNWIACQRDGGSNCPVGGLKNISGSHQMRLDRMIQDVLQVLPQTLPSLAVQRDRGNDISESLRSLNLTSAAFSYLVRMQELVADGSNLLDSEWDEVYNILIQVLKQRQFKEWRKQEKRTGVILSPNHFKIPKPFSLTFPLPKPEPPPIWRGTLRDKRDWEDRLQSRIDQEQTVINGLREAVSSAEEATLPLLRDAAIAASDAQPIRLEAKAKSLTDRLLIDMRASGCQMTTRISQAIQTLQELLWSLRTGQLKDTYPDWELRSTNFDEDWQWLGSYATWRAAMFVYLYPENILYPTLRKWQSSGYRELSQKIQQGRRLNPEVACELAEDFAQYYYDITHLEIEVSCQSGNYAYWYGRAPSGACYWSRYSKSNSVEHPQTSCYDKNNADDYPQTSWKKIQCLSGKAKTIKLFAAVPFGESSILVFAKQKKGIKYQLVLAQHNLNDGSWNSEDEAEELDLPEGTKNFEAVVSQIRSTNQLPDILIKDNESGAIFENRLTADADGWESDPWNRFHQSLLGEANLKAMVPPSLHAEGAYGARYFLFYEDITIQNDSNPSQDLYIVYRLLNPIDSSFELVDVIKYDDGTRIKGSWLGAFLWPDGSRIFAVAKSENQLFLIRVDPATKNVQLHPEPLSSEVWSFWGVETRAIDRLTIDAGLPSDLSHLILVERRRQFSHWAAGRLYLDSDILKVANPWNPDLRNWQIVPSDKHPLQLNAAQPSESQQSRRSYTYTFFDLQEASQGLNPWLRVPASTFNYTEEYYYFVPVLLALELQRRGYYTEALDWYRTIYDYTEQDQVAGETSRRKIWYGLRYEEDPDTTTYQRSNDWLRDPLNPHGIASTRPNTYTRFTLLSLIRCFLEYADFEFTLDTAESVPRARALYTTALQLLDNEVLKQHNDNQCEAIIADLKIKIGEDKTIPVDIKPGLNDLVTELEGIENLPKLEAAAARIDELLGGERPSIPPEPPTNGRPPVTTQPSISSEEMLAQFQEIVEEAKASSPAPTDFGTVLSLDATKTARAHTALLAEPEVFAAVNQLGFATEGAIEPFQPSRTTDTGLIPVSGGNIGMSGRFGLQPESVTPAMSADIAFNPLMRGTSDSESISVPTGERRLYFSRSFDKFALGVIVVGYIPAPSFDFCIPPNLVLRSLRLRAELNLYKLRNCRNIAGMERELEPYAAPTDTVSGLPSIGAGGRLVLPGIARIQPTPYRYAVLIERAKQLVNQAQQFESAMLSALEKRDNEYYQRLKARQDVGLAKAGVRLQNLRVNEAENGVVLAELQRRRAEIQVEQYTEWILYGISLLESGAIGAMFTAGAIHTAAAFFDPSQLAAATSIGASILSTYASYERREQEWQFQKSLAEQDVLIGDQGVTLAQDRVRIVGQELRIAEIQTENAEATADFLANKFTNTHLYEWMSEVLEGVYSFFLQQATAMAKLAENQLAFERQEVPQAFIQADYWEAPTDLASGGNQQGKVPDRRGLTGSARLLQDIYQLDQYAFETNKRKLQLTKTLSLAQLDPFAFQRFRETGVLLFSTPLNLFDRDFPGHYLRLIQRVRTSVIALIPPVQGIHATLSSTGLSRVVIGPDVFQTLIVRRTPESVALTSPQNATGLFELQQQSEMLLPFEGIGIDTSWEFRMPKAANQFDYNTIADVLFTLEYTALDSYDYRQQVIQDLDTRFSGDRPFSFRNQFADAWYDLHNPEQTTTPMTVSFQTVRADFPSNIESLKIQQIVLYFARSSEPAFEIPVTQLRFTEQGSQGSVGGGATPIDGVISTRRGNAGSWTAMIGKSPVGTWELALPNTEEVRTRFQDEAIEDILFIITYSGQTPDWPV